MKTSTFRRTVGVMALATMIAGACSQSDLPMTATTTTMAPQASEPVQGQPERSAATAENWTIPASQGGNGSPSDRKGETDCFTGLYETQQMICFVLRNNTVRLTSSPGVTGKFPLTVSKYFAANANEALGGQWGNGAYEYDGSVAVRDNQDWDCSADCAGRLTPNPFTESAIMQFQSWSTWRGAMVRLFVTSEVSPMGGVQRGAEMQYDSPKWSNTNYSECRSGDYFTCRQISAPDGGGRSKPVYEVGTRPMDITLSFTGSPNYTLVRRGEPVTTGLMLDPAVQSANVTRIKPGERARYGGYRSVGDQGVASIVLTYVVGNADGVTDRTTCEAGAVRVLGCGSTITVELALDKDGKPTSTSRCVPINLTSQTKFSCRTPTFTGTNDGVFLANVDISDVPIR